MDAKIASAISAYGEAAMRFAEGSTTMAATELEPARARLEKLLTETVSLSMYEMVRRERDECARRCRIMEDALTRIRAGAEQFEGGGVVLIDDQRARELARKALSLTGDTSE